MENELNIKIKPEPKKKLKIKKSWQGVFTSPTGYSLTEIYCRRCVEYKNPKEFSSSYDKVMDKNGMMSVCRSCVEEIYQNNLRSEGDIYKAMYKTCKSINWVYHKPSVDYAIGKIKNLKEKNLNDYNLTSQYWAVVVSSVSFIGNIASYTFSDTPAKDYFPKEFLDEKLVNEDVVKFWGEGYTPEDYSELQEHYFEFKRDYKVEVKGEVLLVKEICYKILDLKKARVSGNSTDGLLKEIQILMKNSALTPAMANMANSRKSMDTWGTRIAIIQKEEPSEWLKGEGRREKYFNYGDLQYFKDYYVRSLKNYILGSKDYILEGESQDDSDEDEIELKDMDISENEDAKKTES